ncbi:MAG: glycoside hydrolase family 88 protein [Bacteroidaceae bacterium]|nr:glycoside hydrolase family 88 protein [Bacteroidaceae bacterium]
MAKHSATLLSLLLWLWSATELTAQQQWDETKYREIEQSIQQPELKTREFVVTKMGAVSTPAEGSDEVDGVTAASMPAQPTVAARNQKAIQKAIDKCTKAGGGRVVVPRGQHILTGAITLKSGVNLVIEEGAVLEFAFQPELYPTRETSWEGLDCYNLSPCIYALRANDIAITGSGTIDGGGTRQTWWPWCGAAKYGWQEGTPSQKLGARTRLLQNGEDGVPLTDGKGKPTAERTFTAGDALRPQLIGFNQCQRVLIEGVTLLRSPFWVVHPLKCQDVTVRRVRIENDGPNGDGCDPESCNRVLIEDCHFNTGDDCIAIKSGRNSDGRRRAMPSQNIIIRNCTMQDGHGGVVIGSEISGGCRNVFAHDCTMDSPNLDRVLRIKTNSCRGGVIENIYMRDIHVGQCRESVLKINLDYEHNEICQRGWLPTVRNVLMENVTCKKSKYGVQIIALDEDTLVHDITLRNCHFDGVSQGNTVTGKTRNINYDHLYINGSLTLEQKPHKHYSEWMVRSEMQRTPQSYLLDFSTKPKWSYVMGIELEAMLDTYLRYGDPKVWDYCQEYIDTMITPQGEIRGYRLEDYNLDNVRTGHFVARMMRLASEELRDESLETMLHHPLNSKPSSLPPHLSTLNLLMRQLQNQPRTEQDSIFWHKAIYAYQVWLDGIFMGLPFYTLTASMLLPPHEAQKVYDDAVHQIQATYQRTLDPQTGLNRHAWDETREMFWADQQTGLSQHSWGRAQGWFTMALIELLDALPADYQRRTEVIDILHKDLKAVCQWQDKESGVWYQVMDAPHRAGNYLESTSSSMFCYSLLKAYRKGYVGSEYRDAGIKAYRGILNHFVRVEADSTISLTQCCAVAGLGPGHSSHVQKAAPKVKENRRRDGSFQYYLSEPIRDNDAKGIGPFIWASLEMERLGYDTETASTPIDRQAVLSRNNPHISAADPLAALSVGNGHFATTVDVTGMQSYPEAYRLGVPLTAMSDWGWHRFPNTEDLKEEETQRTFRFPPRQHDEVYAVEYKQGGRPQAATEYFRVNPHRLNLGTIGLQLCKKDGTPTLLSELSSIQQVQKLWDGVIESSFTADGQPVEVITACRQDCDAAIYRIKSPLLQDGQASVCIRFSYPTGKHADDANNWTQPAKHQSSLIQSGHHAAIIQRTLDDTQYFLTLRWEGEATLEQQGAHTFVLKTKKPVLAFEAAYSAKQPEVTEAFVFDQQLKTAERAWNKFWQTGGCVDFGQCTDPRAQELERRVVLSQYLTKVNCANNMPPQETGLTYNSWFGRPHLEMAWWHGVHFSLWNRPQILHSMLEWYGQTAYPVARKIAERQGFQGIRWMKMTDPWAGEAPSNTGSFLIWQQPHYIYMAEEMFRHQPTAETLQHYAELVEETAAFMADWAKEKGASTAMQESMSKDFSTDHPFELAYWHYGLETAQRWRERQGLPRHPAWDDILHKLPPLPQQDSIYTAGKPLSAFSEETPIATFDPFKTPTWQGNATISEAAFQQKSRSDHPAVLGVCGLLPARTYEKQKMQQTLSWVLQNWNWPTTWGWDYGMMAMAAARLGRPQTAIDLLLMNQQKNTYLPSGHNFQTADRLRLYLPGNGALLTAISMMCAGWDGCPEVHNPGFPKDGNWNVRWEGLSRMQ